MSFLLSCGVCCFLLSIWAVVQLTVMGVLYKMEAIPLLEDVMEHDSTDIDEFIKSTRSNFHSTARNCFITAVIYLVMILLSYLCIIKARKTANRLAQEDDDDEIFCSPEAKQKLKQKEKKKSKRDEENN